MVQVRYVHICVCLRTCRCTGALLRIEWDALHCASNALSQLIWTQWMVSHEK